VQDVARRNSRQTAGCEEKEEEEEEEKKKKKKKQRYLPLQLSS
jgi:hypothetical protein